ncbi:uncharacterized protein LOC107269125 isoform X1 [Cephus cinctus]|uniref:Uncharacterized protein LOC107269125 isoform X1 n=1 Tax=Cephus cinctus TaxID=211228 RepID=A0AAJ7C000_CEPCN|nr:uncharacterized protein LOC107269125 isoform X1 [Cephus cinctus]
MPCSAVTLSLATITGIIATALLAIAFSTDNWLYTEVKRAQIQQYAAKHAEQSHLVEQMNTKYYYYTRTQGLFRICYPKERPPAVETYLSPVETHCMNIDYFIPDEENQTRGFSDDAMARLHMGRSVIALFMVGFLAIFSAFWTGVVGCWRRSPGNITATAILMLLACLLSAGGMGLWHGVEYYEKEKIVGEEYYQQWSNCTRRNSSTRMPVIQHLQLIRDRIITVLNTGHTITDCALITRVRRNRGSNRGSASETGSQRESEIRPGSRPRSKRIKKRSALRQGSKIVLGNI